MEWWTTSLVHHIDLIISPSGGRSGSTSFGALGENFKLDLFIIKYFLVGIYNENIFIDK